MQNVRLRRTSSLFACWKDKQLVFHNFARRLKVSGKPITCEVLDFFGKWRTPREAIAHFQNYSERSVRGTVSQLVTQGLLVSEGSPEAAQDRRIEREWSPWLPEG